jgi:hypothetical protein
MAKQSGFYTLTMKGKLYQILRMWWKDLTSMTGYGDWSGSKNWQIFGEMLLLETGNFDFPSGPNPQIQIEQFLRDCSDDEFDKALIIVQRMKEKEYSVTEDWDKIFSDGIREAGIPVIIHHETVKRLSSAVDSKRQDKQYESAQICLNGHVITSLSHSYPGALQNFCTKCGAETISQCRSCHLEIIGTSTSANLPSHFEYSAPAYCPHCGAAYPWTESRLKAAKELAEELDGLKSEEKILLKQSIDGLVKDTPGTSLAATRFKKLAAKGGKAAAAGFKEILIDIISETAKKMIWPGT